MAGAYHRGVREHDRVGRGSSDWRGSCFVLLHGVP